MLEPKVTVAMPVYNGMPHVKTAVESVLSQTHQNIELVIVDNGSTDDSRAYLDTITDSRVILDPNPTNLGIANSWNKCLDQAVRSPYFKLVCADDFLYPECIATEVSILERNPNVVMTASRRAIVDDDGKVLMKARGLPGLDGVVNGKKAVRRSVLWGTNILGEPSAVMLRSSALDGLRFDVTHQLLVDFDMWAKVLQRGDLYAIRHVLSVFRVGMLSNSLAIAKKHREMHIGEFRKLQDDPTVAIDALTVGVGSVMALGQTTARNGFYVLLNARDKLTGRAKA